MRHQTHESAMTEIALALAMGFFSIMVLTLISFGAPAATSASNMAAVTVMPLKADATGGAVETAPDDLIVIAHDGIYLAADMSPLSLDAIDAHVGRVVLAIDPATPLQTVLKLRGGLKARDLVVVNLNADWRAALSSRTGAPQ
jgi:hypothetical protein